MNDEHNEQDEIEEGRLTFKRALKRNWLLIVGFIALCVGYAFITNQTALLQSKISVQNRQLVTAQSKLQTLKDKNSHIMYLPNPKDVNLTATQVSSISWLNSFFAQITTFNNKTSYQTNYDYAKAHIHDSTFFKTFLSKPYDQYGTSVVDATNMKMKNIRVQVLVTGANTYRVFVTYVPYHASSDLYQLNSLTTVTRAFTVTGLPGNYSRAYADKSIRTNDTTYTVGNLQ